MTETQTVRQALVLVLAAHNINQACLPKALVSKKMSSYSGGHLMLWITCGLRKRHALHASENVTPAMPFVAARNMGHSGWQASPSQLSGHNGNRDLTRLPLEGLFRCTVSLNQHAQCTLHLMAVMHVMLEGLWLCAMQLLGHASSLIGLAINMTVDGWPALVKEPQPVCGSSSDALSLAGRSGRKKCHAQHRGQTCMRAMQLTSGGLHERRFRHPFTTVNGADAIDAG